MTDESTNEKIKNGQGLSPLPTTQTSSISGITTEQRNLNSGIRYEQFSKQEKEE